MGEALTSVHRVSFFVPGIAQPKGSTRAFMRPGMRYPAVTSDNPRLKDWQYQVAAVAAQQGVQPLHGAVELAVTFYLPRPKSLPKRVEYHTKKPDLDKLLRAVKDGLKGIGYVDDSQVVSVAASKHYSARQVGAWISLEAAR